MDRQLMVDCGLGGAWGRGWRLLERLAWHNQKQFVSHSDRKTAMKMGGGKIDGTIIYLPPLQING